VQARWRIWCFQDPACPGEGCIEDSGCRYCDASAIGGPSYDGEACPSPTPSSGCTADAKPCAAAHSNSAIWCFQDPTCPGKGCVEDSGCRYCDASAIGGPSYDGEACPSVPSLGAALAPEETTTALPAAQDVNTTAGARRLGTGYCIDAGSNGNPNTGDQIITWECTAEAAQEWLWAADSSGNYYIKYAPNPTKCMTVTCDTGLDCNGHPVTFEDCADSSYQQFGGANGHIYRRRLRRVTAAPCLLAYAYVAELWAQSLVKLSDHVFPQPLGEPFGEHVWEEEENEENEEDAVLEASWVHLGPSWALLGPYWLSLEPSWGLSWTVLGALRILFGRTGTL